MLTVMNFSEAMQTEADTMYENFTMAVLLATFLFQTKDVEITRLTGLREYALNFVTIVACVKLSFFFDREKSLNF